MDKPRIWPRGNPPPSLPSRLRDRTAILRRGAVVGVMGFPRILPQQRRQDSHALNPTTDQRHKFYHLNPTGTQRVSHGALVVLGGLLPGYRGRVGIQARQHQRVKLFPVLLEKLVGAEQDYG